MPSFLPAGRWLKAFPHAKGGKKSSQHSVSSQRPFKSSGRFSNEVSFTAREVLGLISYMWQCPGFS